MLPDIVKEFQLYPSIEKVMEAAKPTSLRLLFVLTPGIRLLDWYKLGTLNRELQPYLYHVRLGGKVSILQYRRSSFPVMPPGISLIQVPHWRLSRLWEILSPQFRQSVDVIKTNQSLLSYRLVQIAQRWDKPIVLRCGYIRGQSLEQEHGLSPAVKAYHKVEGWAFRNATLVQVPTDDNWLKQRYAVNPEKVRVVPNFVDTDQFSPHKVDGSTRTVFKIISVGRLAEVKRFDLLVKACSITNGIEVNVAGEGTERDRLLDLARQLNVSLRLPGQIPNNQLPEFLNSGDIFVATSKREGHPKALIEAMSCGLPCISVAAPGLRNLVSHEHNGLLVEDTPQAIAHAISRVIDDPSLRERLGRNARQFVTDHFDVRRIVQMNLDVLEEAVELNNGRQTECS